MSQNSERWLRLYESVESIDGVNVYIEPVDPLYINPPFVVLDPDNLRNIADSGQGHSVFNGLHTGVTVGVYTKRDDKLVQKEEIKECIELFETVDSVIKLETNGSNTDNKSTVVGDNMNVYAISYSGYYNK